MDTDNFHLFFCKNTYFIFIPKNYFEEINLERMMDVLIFTENGYIFSLYLSSQCPALKVIAPLVRSMLGTITGPLLLPFVVSVGSMIPTPRFTITDEISFTPPTKKRSKKGLAPVGVGAAKEIVGLHLLVGGAVVVEVEGQGLRQRVIGEQRVGLVEGLQVGQLLPHIGGPAPLAGGQEGKEQKGENEAGQMEGYAVHSCGVRVE